MHSLPHASAEQASAPAREGRSTGWMQRTDIALAKQPLARRARLIRRHLVHFPSLRLLQLAKEPRAAHKVVYVVDVLLRSIGRRLCHYLAPPRHAVEGDVGQVGRKELGIEHGAGPSAARRPRRRRRGPGSWRGRLPRPALHCGQAATLVAASWPGRCEKVGRRKGAVLVNSGMGGCTPHPYFSASCCPQRGHGPAAPARHRCRCRRRRSGWRRRARPSWTCDAAPRP